MTNAFAFVGGFCFVVFCLFFFFLLFFYFPHLLLFFLFFFFWGGRGFFLYGKSSWSSSWFVCAAVFPPIVLCWLEVFVQGQKRSEHKAYSHSVVPGGFDVRSKTTLDTPSTFSTSATIWFSTSIGISGPPGTAGTPVMKSFVMNVRMAMERFVVSVVWPAASKSMGNETMGTCDRIVVRLFSMRSWLHAWSAARSCTSASGRGYVGVIALNGPSTLPPNTKHTRLMAWHIFGMSFANFISRGQFGSLSLLRAHRYEYVRPSPCTPTVLKGRMQADTPDCVSSPRSLPNDAFAFSTTAAGAVSRETMSFTSLSTSSKLLHTNGSAAQMRRTPRPGPGKGWRITSTFGRPRAIPSSRTSSLW
eukprot:Rhum_TRINITY_DN14585_c16_g1::Rhum_TRINITY_DN14585_c16_g1_i1::g.101218::m.101218